MGHYASTESVRWRVLSESYPHSSHGDDLRPVHSESDDCGSPGRRQSDQFGIVGSPREMIRPGVGVRTIQWHDLLRPGIQCGDTVSLVPIARGTGEAEILEGRRAAT